LVKIKTVSQHTKSKPVPIFQDQLAIDIIYSNQENHASIT